MSGLSVAGLILSIVWIGGLGSVLAVIFGVMALSRIRRSRERPPGGAPHVREVEGRGLAVAAIVIGAVGVLATAALYTGLAVRGRGPAALTSPTSYNVRATRRALEENRLRLSDFPSGWSA
jgi:hypothetical protein